MRVTSRPQPTVQQTQPLPPRPVQSSDPDPSGFTPNRPAPLSLNTATQQPVVRSPGNEAVTLARSVLGWNAHDLKLQNGTVMGDAMQDWVGDKVNCANFVSAVLTASGQIPKSGGHAAVTTLISKLKKDPNFVQTDLSRAKPCDVVAFKTNGGHHIVIFQGLDSKGQPKFIGSNNRNKDGTQVVSEMTGVPKGWSVLGVMHYQGPAPTIPQGKLTPTMNTLDVGPGGGPTAPTQPTAPTAPGKGLENVTTNPQSFLKNGSSGPQVEELQKMLKDAGFDPGPLDGKFGPKTRAAVLAFQQGKGLQVDGVVGPQTRAALLGLPPVPPGGVEPSGGATPPESPAQTTPVAPSVPSGDTKTAQALEAEALQKHGPEFVQKVKDLAGRLGVKPEWILAVMKNESGMSTTAKNPNGGATGLIQFMPATARGLGTTTDALSKMSAVEQLKYVEKYYAPFAGKIKSGTDLYMATFWPAGVGKGDDYKIGGAEVARVNKIFDLDKNGQITAGEFREYYRKRFPELG